jgi:hypothetical protein
MLAAPVAEGGLLGPSACLVDHGIGQPDGVEVVHHPGVAKRYDQCAGIAAPRVQRHRADPGQPVTRPGAEPAVHRGPGAVGHQIQQPAALQVDQASDPSGRRRRGCSKKARLVQAEGRHTLQASSVLHQRPAVISHRPHHGRPANPEVTSDRGHRVSVLADPPTRLSAGPLSQHRPRADRGHPLGPAAHAAGRLPTAPDPLAPPQHHRTATDRQVPHPNRTAAMELSPHPTTLTADHGGRGLDGELPLTGRDLRGEDLKPSRPSSLEAEALRC